jgi:hypothetical protein
MERERRGAPRVPAKAGSRGHLRSRVEVEILDVSIDGLRLELATSLRPGAEYDLKALLSDLDFSAQIRITRCSAGGFRDDGRGGRFLVYKTGAQFLWEGPEQKAALSKHLDKVSGQRPRSSSNSGILRLRS